MVSFKWADLPVDYVLSSETLSNAREEAGREPFASIGRLGCGLMVKGIRRAGAAPAKTIVSGTPVACPWAGALAWVAGFHDRLMVDRNRE
ncbi:hypothetical protein [Acidocella sp.]|jgi:hypothetical protein|uniref:hypothetical protein n=1 Tax=Acidocella sp. TaxID=50710 RepID=UPI002F3F9DC7